MVKTINGQEVKLMTFDDISKLAAKEGVHLDKVSVGIWAKQNKLIKTRKQIGKKVYIGYYKESQLKTDAQ